MFTKFEMLRVGFESLGARPAPNPKLLSYIPTLFVDPFFSPPCFSDYAIFYGWIDPVFAMSFIADL